LKKLPGILSLAFLLAACSPTSEVTPQLVTVYSSQAAAPWLSGLYGCAGDSGAALALTDRSSAQIVLQIGEPETLTTPAFEIDSEEILIVTGRESPVRNLTLDEARALFSGQGDPSVQVWVYPSDADVQRAFDRVVMSGRSVSSLARLAAGPQQMSDVVNAESNAVGILPRHWKAGDARDVYAFGPVPVLAITQSEPALPGPSAGVIRTLIACLQK
jgi:hypothetical protein